MLGGAKRPPLQPRYAPHRGDLLLRRRPPLHHGGKLRHRAGISDMLLQGWGDIVRVFPALPTHWRDVAFRDLRAEGVRVSAIRRDSRTVWVKVGAGVDRTLRLRDPFGGAPIRVTGGTLHREGDLYVGELAAGQEVIPLPEGETGDLDMAAAAVQASDTSRFGLR